MGWSKRLTVATATAFAATVILLQPLYVLAAEDDEKARGQFEKVLAGINEHSFAPAKSAIDKNELTQRVHGIRIVDAEVNKAFSENFWQIVEGEFLGSMPNANSDVTGEIVDFKFQDGQGVAAVRYKLPRFTYAYQVWELRHDRRQRLKIVDWYDSRIGQNFSAEISEGLVVLMPNRPATRRLLSNKSPSDRQLFQVTELLKAARDRQAPRFFEIYDDLDAGSKEEPLLAKFAVEMAFDTKDGDIYSRTLGTFSNVYGTSPEFGLMLSDAYLSIEDYERSYSSLVQFHENFDVAEGATPARLSALALALGKDDDAEKYALEATNAEPTLELGWWSLLRARASKEDFQAATEVLTRLEDDFGHRIDMAKLRRDRYRSFLGLADSQEFKDWRAGRP